MSAVDDLAAFVAARLDEDEARANAMQHDGDGDPWIACPATRTEPLGDLEWGEDHCWCGLAGRKSRALREVAAKRAIMDEHPREPLDGDGGSVCDRCADWTEPARTDEDRRMSWPCSTVRHLATTWSDHPDYRPEWKP